MKHLSKIYLEAAKLIDAGIEVFSCDAIYEACHDRSSEVPLQLFHEFFCPADLKGFFLAFWFGDATPRNQNARVLALLFMAEIAGNL